MAQNVAKNALNEKESAVLTYHLEGKSNVEIADVLSFSESWVSWVLAKPHVQAALYDAQRRILRQAATEAIKNIREMARESAPTEGLKRIRLDANKFLAQIGGHSSQGASQAAGGREKGISEMSLEEIENALQKELERRGNEAKTIDQKPGSDQGSDQEAAQDVDIFE